MDNAHTERALINNELAARGANKRSKEVIENHIPENEKNGLKIDFRCECSDPNCQERISITLEDFEQLHDEHDKFVIVKGHKTPSIEKVLKTRHNIQVVEKFAL